MQVSSGPDRLRQLMKDVRTLYFPICFDAVSAKLVQQSGLPCVFMSGYGIAASRFGMPDTGMVTGSELADQLRNICGAVPGFPVLADGDTGYGNAMNVRRTVTDYARAGAAAIMLEDQVHPKRCGHFGGGREVISHEEAVSKIRAALDARALNDILIIARTDARGALGFNKTLDRCKAFEEAGADIVFMEAPESEQELRDYTREIRAATWYNPAPKTPVLERSKIEDMGFKFVTYNGLLPSAIKAMQTALDALKKDRLDLAPPSVTFNEMNAVIGLPEYQSIEANYKVG
jgi:2-methylisocitrate lyase-like PEP mutase family enzyme